MSELWAARTRGWMHGAALVALAAALLGGALRAQDASAVSAEEPASGARGPSKDWPRERDLTGPGWTLWRDAAADWQREPPTSPGTPLTTRPAPAPSGGWDALDTGRAVSVPDSLEALFGAEEDDPRGVSWWSRTLILPDEVVAHPERYHAELEFSSVGRRAEVFVDRVLLARDDVGYSPFSVKLPLVALGTQARLDVRVTDPGGNFGWEDEHAQHWGDTEHTLPAAHGFGGLLGGVLLRIVPREHVVDAWVSMPEASPKIAVHLELAHAGGGGTRELFVQFRGQDRPRTPHGFDAPRRFEVALPEAPGILRHDLTLDVSTHSSGVTNVPVRLWSPDHPKLYDLAVRFGEDELVHPVGLRRFDIVTTGDDHELQLNGEPIFLRSAISWGYWPRTGAIPSPELARRQVETARDLGLNMLNHHRGFVHPRLLAHHDRLGLLAYLEPGGYASVGGDDVALALARERWLRLVRVGRRHPSVVMANMINEAKTPPTEQQQQDLRDAQAMAPELLLTYTSAWAETDEPALSMHARPGEAGLHTQGWFDQHNAPGPGVWRDEFWKGPDEHLLRHEPREAVVFLGEDGAIGSPPNLARLLAEWGPHPAGWDGAAYGERLQSWRRDLAAQGWAVDLPALDALFASFGDLVLDYHARVIENLRLDGVVDGYVINGWDDQKVENHSGIVDARRHSKGDPARLARASAPRLLAIKPRASVLQVRPLIDAERLATTLGLDLGLVDESGLLGEHRWQLVVRDENDRVLHEQAGTLNLDGRRHTRWLLRDAQLELAAEPGWLRLEASLSAGAEPGGARQVVARERVLAVDGRHRPAPAAGSVLGPARRRLNAWLQDSRREPLRSWTAADPDIDWVMVGGVDLEPMTTVPAEAFVQSVAPDAEPGLSRSLFAGEDFDEALEQGVDETLEVLHDPVAWPGGLRPPFGMRWEGALVPPESGLYRLRLRSSGGVRLYLSGQLVLEQWPDHAPDMIVSRAFRFEEGVPVHLRVDYLQQHTASRVVLDWSTPSASAPARFLSSGLLREVAERGVDVVVLTHSETWARELERLGSLSSVERLQMGRYWMGGGFFARPHELLAGLPAEGALGREWQDLVHYGQPLVALRAAELQRVVGATTGHDPRLGTALGWVQHGRGRVLLCTMETLGTLEKGPGSADLVRHLLLNMMEWAASDG